MFDTTTKTFTGMPSQQISCWCGVAIAIPRSLYDEYIRANGVQSGSFALRCPLGHTFVPAGRSEADKLRDQLAREQHRREQAEADAQHERRRVALRDRQIAARKGQVTRLRKRIENGVCPCCNRHFGDLHAHMRTQHPGWRPEEEPLTGLVPPDGLAANEREAWLRGASAASLARTPANPHRNRGRGARLFRAWQTGLDAARAASTAEPEA